MSFLKWKGIHFILMPIFTSSFFIRQIRIFSWIFNCTCVLEKVKIVPYLHIDLNLKQCLFVCKKQVAWFEEKYPIVSISINFILHYIWQFICNVHAPRFKKNSLLSFNTESYFTCTGLFRYKYTMKGRHVFLLKKNNTD